MATPSRRTSLARLALALLFAAAPGLLPAQDTASAPASTAPRVNLPAGTRVTRPPLNPPPTVSRPPAGTAAPSQEPNQQQLATVPNLEGRTVDEARRLLAAAGLVVGAVAEGTGSGTPGTIVQQQPQAGSVVAPKSDVRLWLAPRAATAQQPPVSRPPPTRPALQLVTVPRLAGRTVEDARATLARVDLQVGAVAEASGGGAPGTIVRQSPAPGFPVARGSSVRVWIAPARVAQQPPQQTPQQTPAAPLVVRVPSVVGQTAEQARETLTAAGLTPGTLAEATGAAGIPGTIARQQPAAGSATVPNARVGLWLVPARRAVMPAIMGLPLDRAQALVRQAGLRTGEVAGEGRVIGHTFEAGAQVRPGSVVNISLGMPPGEVGQVATRPDPPPARPQPQPQPEPPAQRPTPAQDSVAVAAPPAAPSAVDSAVVPDVRRLAFAQAQAALAAAGFAAVVDAALVDSAGWTVTAQQPSPGARLAAGGRVALLLDPPAPLASAPAAQPPVAGPTRPAPQPPAAARPEAGRRTLWIGIAALLLVAAAAAVGARRMRAARRVPPIAAVSARLRMDTPARVAVEGMPFGEARLRLRMSPGRTAARVAAAGPLFVQKEVTGD